MSTLLLWQRLTAEKAALEGFLSKTAEADILGRMSLEARLAELSEELERFAASPRTRAEVALVFHGEPVTGSTAVQASFGGKALDAFQKSVATAFALQTGAVSERGPTKDKDLSALHITGVVHGSFGFVLEEIDPRGDQFIGTSLKAATDNVFAVLDQISAEDEGVAEQAINEINERLFVNVRELVSLIHDSNASMNLVGPDMQMDLEGLKLERAYRRTVEAQIQDEEVTLRGVLQGLLPTARKFEFQTISELIKGSVARDISEEYLKTLDSNPLTGRTLLAKFKKRTLVDRLGGIKRYYTLVQVVDDGAGGSHPLLPSDAS